MSSCNRTLKPPGPATDVVTTHEHRRFGISATPPAEKTAAHGVRRFFVRQKGNDDQLAAIAELVVNGTVKVNVENVLPLPEARKAQELSQTGHSGGKIVLE